MLENANLDAATLLKALTENIADSIYFKDLQCRILWASRKMATSLGCEDPTEIIGKTDGELFGEEFGQKTRIDDLRVMETAQPIIGLVESRTLPNGEINWTSTSKLPIRDEEGKVIGLLGISREINELMRAEQDLHYMATHDILTSLVNRFFFLDCLESALRRARRKKTMLAILFIDLDKFKSINDRWGHDVGDLALKQVAGRLSSAVRDVDVIARMGGDEFTVLLEELSNPEDALSVAEKVRETIAQELTGLPTGARVTASIGVSLFPLHAESSAMLLRIADRAMYQAKQRQDSCVLYAA